MGPRGIRALPLACVSCAVLEGQWELSPGPGPTLPWRRGGSQGALLEGWAPHHLLCSSTCRPTTRHAREEPAQEGPGRALRERGGPGHSALSCSFAPSPGIPGH